MKGRRWAMGKTYVLLDVAEDGENKTLCFTSEDDALRFKKFVNTYMLESGVGNGYGAYWVFRDEKPTFARRLRDVVEINRGLVDDMLNRILLARTAGNPQDTAVEIAIGKQDGALTFKVGELPPRQRPRIGDMYRVVTWKLRNGAGKHTEGRVVAESGDMLGVISCFDYEKGGKIKVGAAVYKLKADEVMRINDWLAEHDR